jgi:ADP-heptose:LPS heptosyltransferase
VENTTAQPLTTSTSVPLWQPPGAVAGRQGSPRILLIRPRKIGDVVLCTPLFQALREAYPTAYLAFLTQHSCAQLLATNPHLDRVFVYPSKDGGPGYLGSALELRRVRFDVVIDLFSSPATARAAWLSGAKKRIGYRMRGRTLFYTDPVVSEERPQYIVWSLADLLKPIGVPVKHLDPILPIAPEWKDWGRALLTRLGVQPGELVVGLVPGAHEPPKLWQPERYAAVADWLIDAFGAKILLIHGPGEEPITAAVRQAMSHPALPAIPPVENLGHLAGLYSHLSLYLGSDVGTRHIAIAEGVPSVGLFGRGFPESWTPPNRLQHQALAFDPGCKRACTYPACTHLSCIRTIATSWVQDAIKGLLPAMQERANAAR